MRWTKRTEPNDQSRARRASTRQITTQSIFTGHVRLWMTMISVCLRASLRLTGLLCTLCRMAVSAVQQYMYSSTAVRWGSCAEVPQVSSAVAARSDWGRTFHWNACRGPLHQFGTCESLSHSRLLTRRCYSTWSMLLLCSYARLTCLHCYVASQATPTRTQTPPCPGRG